MKKLLALFVFCFLPGTPKVHAQAQELQQLALNIEKLAQFKAILRDMKKGYEILSGGYSAVKDLTEGNFNLHKTFLDALLQVSPAVRNYRRVPDIINYQIQLTGEYHKAFDRFSSSTAFNDKEIGYMEAVYANLMDQSLKNLEELTMVLTANQLRMSDDERLEAIDRIYLDMQDKLSFLREFNNTASILALQRAKETNDVKAIGRAYELTH